MKFMQQKDAVFQGEFLYIYKYLVLITFPFLFQHFNLTAFNLTDHLSQAIQWRIRIG